MKYLDIFARFELQSLSEYTNFLFMLQFSILQLLAKIFDLDLQAS